MEFKKKSATEVELHQPPTPTFFLESWSRFKLVAPHYIDFAFGCRPNAARLQSRLHRPVLGELYQCPERQEHVFAWQGYVVATLHTGPQCDEYSPAREGRLRPNVCARAPRLPVHEPIATQVRGAFFDGLFRDMTMIVMLDRTDGVRFTHSPSGGGNNVERQTTNPAWDFQLSDPEVRGQRGLRLQGPARVSTTLLAEEVLKEYAAWKKG